MLNHALSSFKRLLLYAIIRFIKSQMRKVRCSNDCIPAVADSYTLGLILYISLKSYSHRCFPEILDAFSTFHLLKNVEGHDTRKFHVVIMFQTQLLLKCNKTSAFILMMFVNFHEINSWYIFITIIYILWKFCITYIQTRKESTNLQQC